MSSCPVCETEIAESFGLIECPSCNSVLFVDFDGSLKVQESADEKSAEVAKVEPKVEAPAEWLTEEEPKTSIQNKVLQEIQNFSDSDKSNLFHGSLFYNITLYNVDTQDLRDEIVEILKDGKFHIDLKKINFKLPQLTIKDLNAVKASVLVTRLKHLPIDIEWTQTSILQSDSSEGKT